MVELVEMDEAALAAWLPGMFEGYVEQRIAAGEPAESARRTAKAQHEQLFPGGRPAEGQHVMGVVVDGERVGTLWMGRPFGGEEGTWFVFYVEVDEARRGQGLGRVAMEAAERFTREHGGARVALNVFGQNVVARNLYESLGYQVMAIGMYKDL